MKEHAAGARALMPQTISVAPRVTSQLQVIAMRFKERFDAHRDEGISNATVYVMASAEAETYLRKIERESSFA